MVTALYFLRLAMEALVQAVLEAEMSQPIGAEKGERTAGRLAYRSGDCHIEHQKDYKKEGLQAAA